MSTDTDMCSFISIPQFLAGFILLVEFLKCLSIHYLYIQVALRKEEILLVLFITF